MLKPTIIYTDLQYYVQAAQSGNNIHDKYKPTMIYVHADSIKYKQTIIQCIYKLTMQCIS